MLSSFCNPLRKTISITEARNLTRSLHRCHFKGNGSRINKKYNWVSKGNYYNHGRNSSTATEMLQEPSRKQLQLFALRAAIPMVGFGFMDNLVMIQAGEAIDMTIGVAFGLSTMTAAGLGQCVSDVAGTTCGGMVDSAVAKLNLPHHGLSEAQQLMKRARIYRNTGGCIGVVIGCLLGMSCLLFMDTGKTERLKKAKEMDSIFHTLMEEGHNYLNCYRCTLWLVDKDSGELWSKTAAGNKIDIKVHGTYGVVDSCIKEGEIINIHDAYKDERFDPRLDNIMGIHTTSIIAVPIKDDRGKAIGVIQMINKANPDGSPGVFDETDTKMLTMICEHVGHFIRVVTRS